MIAAYSSWEWQSWFNHQGRFAYGEVKTSEMKHDIKKKQCMYICVQLRHSRETPYMYILIT